MTEINLFPKQPQSVTVLVFITVLIVLLLILNGTYEEQKTETYAGRTDGGKTAFG